MDSKLGWCFSRHAQVMAQPITAWVAESEASCMPVLASILAQQAMLDSAGLQQLLGGSCGAVGAACWGCSRAQLCHASSQCYVFLLLSLQSLRIGISDLLPHTTSSCLQRVNTFGQPLPCRTPA